MWSIALFSFISINWRGRPLTDYQVILEVIANTATAARLTVTSHLDTSIYPTGITISDADFAAVPVVPQDFQGEAGYVGAHAPAIFQFADRVLGTAFGPLAVPFGLEGGSA